MCIRDRHETVRSVNVYLVAYVLLFSVSLLIVSINGHDFETNFTSVATTINNVGPGFHLAGPVSNFSFFSPLSKVVLIVDMIADVYKRQSHSFVHWDAVLEAV